MLFTQMDLASDQSWVSLRKHEKSYSKKLFFKKTIGFIS